MTNTCGGGANAAPLPPDMGLPPVAAALPCLPTGLLLLEDSVFLTRAKIMNVIFLRANTAFLPLHSA